MDPRVQGTYMKQFASRVELLGDVGEDVVAADPELFAEIEAAGCLSWIPAELNVRLVAVINDVLGRERAHHFLADQISSQLSTPLWSGFIEGSIRALGLDPAVLSRWIPRALGLAFRDYGEWSVERLSDTRCALHARWLPPVMTADRRWLESVASGCNALFLLCRTSGESHLTVVDALAGSASIELRWKPAAE